MCLFSCKFQVFVAPELNTVIFVQIPGFVWPVGFKEAVVSRVCMASELEMLKFPAFVWSIGIEML